MKKIALHGCKGKGKFTLVDAEDFELANRYHWTLNHNGYAMTDISCKSVLLHHFITGFKWYLTNGQEIDHISGDKLDNQKANLRPATRTQNCQNAKKRKGTSSKYKGVSWDKERGKWIAYINYGGKMHFLGRYHDEEDAAEVYDLAALRWFDYPRFNRRPQ